jgi:NAD(P)-dependent dehydrogenase (short-subunit alcohol dehydrogenase family)
VRKERDREAQQRLEKTNLIPVYPLDLTSQEDIENAVRNVEVELERRRIKGLFALVNNAGGGSIAPIELIDLRKLRQEWETRILGSVSLVQRLLPQIRRANGRILWIATPATIPTPFVASIHACDFAVNCLARTLDLELKPWKIRQIMVRCGGIRTEAVAKSSAELEDSFRTWPHGRREGYEERLRCWKEDMDKFDKKRTDPEEVAEVVLRALIARKPKRRYSVGYMARAAAFLESMPQVWADFILRMRF